VRVTPEIERQRETMFCAAPLGRAWCDYVLGLKPQESVGFETERRAVWASNLKRGGHLDRLLWLGVADKFIEPEEIKLPNLGLAVTLPE